MGLITIVQPSLSDQAALDYYRSIAEGAVSGNTKSQTNEAGGGGGGGTVLFQSDWRTQTNGTGNSRIQDGTKWDNENSGDRLDTDCQIIDAPSADWPTAKVLRVAFNDPDPETGTQGALLLARTGLGSYQTGVPRNYRWYYSNREPDGLGDADQHYAQDGGSVSAQNWGIYTWSKSAANGGYANNVGAGQYIIYVGLNGDRYYYSTNNNASTGPIPLTKDVPYRFEIQIVRVNSTQFRCHMWLYDHDDVLLASDINFKNCSTGSGSLADDPLITFNNEPGADKFMFGNNGIGQNTPGWTTVAHGDEAGVIIVEGLDEEEEIGPYATNYAEEIA